MLLKNILFEQYILNQGGIRHFAIVTHADIRGLVTDLTYMRRGACLFLLNRDHQLEKPMGIIDQLMPI
jgi:hypothetical protein